MASNYTSSKGLYHSRQKAVSIALCVAFSISLTAPMAMANSPMSPPPMILSAWQSHPVMIANLQRQCLMILSTKKVALDTMIRLRQSPLRQQPGQKHFEGQ
jgi:hypothetical protein